MLKRIHHINFVVHDLEKAIKQYKDVLNLNFDQTEHHPKRPVKTARCELGETWLVLVQPLDEDSPPGQFLRNKGEGLFLISYQVDDIDAAIDTIVKNGGFMMDEIPRKGISNWQVADLSIGSTFGAVTQICQETTT